MLTKIKHSHKCPGVIYSCLICVFYISALVLAIALATLPLKKLVDFYMYIVCSALLYLAYHLSYQYVVGERETECELLDTSILEDTSGTKRLVLHLGTQCIIAAIIAYLLEIHNWTRFILLVFTLPMVCRILGIKGGDIIPFHNGATIFVVLNVAMYLFNYVGYVLDTIKEGINQTLMFARLMGWLPVLVAFWHTILLPVQLLLFWFVMFMTQMYVYLYSDHHPILEESWIIVILAGIGECCATLISLFALSVTISYVSYCVITLTRIYLQGWKIIPTFQFMKISWSVIMYFHDMTMLLYTMYHENY